MGRAGGFRHDWNATGVEHSVFVEDYIDAVDHRLGSWVPESVPLPPFAVP